MRNAPEVWNVRVHREPGGASSEEGSFGFKGSQPLVCFLLRLVVSWWYPGMLPDDFARHTTCQLDLQHVDRCLAIVTPRAWCIRAFQAGDLRTVEQCGGDMYAFVLAPG